MKGESIDKLKQYFDERKYRIASFFLCLFAMYLYLSYSSIMQNGDGTKLGGDTFSIYVSATRQFFRDLLAGENLSYSWSNCFGMNVIPYYASYMGGSIFNFLFLFFYDFDQSWVLSVVLTLKIALAGSAFVFFMEKTVKQRGIHTIVFSLFYAFSGAQMCLYIHNYIWMDAEYMLPLILVLIKELLEEGKWFRLLLAYAYLFACSFFMGYMVGIFSAIFFVLYCFLNMPKNRILSKLIRFGLVAISAAGVMAFMLLPTAVFLFTEMPPDSTGGEEVVLSIMALLSSVLFGRQAEMYVMQPYFYSGIITVILFPLFFVSKKIKKEEKILYGTLLVIMILSCVVPCLYMFWHGFDATDGWHYRFSYLVTFLLSVMACTVWGILFETEENNHKKNSLFLLVFGIVEMTLLSITGCFYRQTTNMIWSIIVSFVVLILWYGLISWKMNIKEKIYLGETKKIELISVLMLIVCIIEVVANGCVVWKASYSKEKIDNWSASAEKALVELESDQSFYRVNFTNSRNQNWDSYWGFIGNSDFCSTENYKVRNVMAKLGAYASPRFMSSYGLNPFTQFITGVKYNIIGTDDYALEEDQSKKVVELYDYYLSVGFMVNKDICDFEFCKENIYQNCNHLASTMVGKEVSIFDEFDKNMITCYANNMELEYIDNKYYLYLPEENSGLGQLTFMVENREEPLYFTFERDDSQIINQSAIIMKGTDEANDVGSLGVTYSNKVNSKNGKCEVSIIMRQEDTNTADFFEDYYVYECDEKQLESLYQELSDRQLSIQEYGNGYLKGRIHVADENQVLFTTIPFDEGWTLVTAEKGVKMISLLEDAFVGISFEQPGDYEIILSYDNKYLRYGIGITFCSILLILIVYFWNFTNSKRHNVNS